MRKTVTVNDKFQKNFKYDRTMPVGKLSPEFKPFFTPAEMLELGVFEGKYMNDCQSEFPSLFKKAKLSKHPNPKINLFQVKSRQPWSVWKQNGWLHKDDPRGWFQWFCRYYYGRRHEDDNRQIKRWKAFARHSAQVKINAVNKNKENPLYRAKQRQALLQWSHNPFPESEIPRLLIARMKNGQKHSDKPNTLH